MILQEIEEIEEIAIINEIEEKPDYKINVIEELKKIEIKSEEFKNTKDKVQEITNKKKKASKEIEEIEVKILSIKKVIDVLRMKRSMAITQILTSYPSVEQELDDHFKSDQVNEKIVKLVRKKEE